MTEHDAKGLTRREFLECSVGAAVTVGVLPACGGGEEKAGSPDGSNAGSTSTGTGTGGNQSTSTGNGGSSKGGSGTGGSTGKGGATATTGGGSQTGGSSATGGSGNGGSGNGGSGNGGSGNGGSTSTGGQVGNGGSTSTGGKATGGSATGGNATTGGRTSTGGSTATGGKSTGGTSATGGNATTGGNTQTGGTVGTGGSTSSTGKALVGIVRNTNVATAVADAVAIAGGIPSLTGKTVLIKPNVVCTNPSPYATNPAVVAALIDLVNAKGASRVIVADRSDPGWVTANSFNAAGITSVVSNAQGDVRLLDLGTGGFTVLKPSGATNWPNGIAYSDLVRTGMDYIINVPCCKHHLMAGFTAAIKNWMGIIAQEGPGGNCGRGWAHGANINDLGLRLPELHLGVREDLVVMDATKIALTEGPFGPGGREASPNIIVASVDPVAVDVVAICLLKHYLKQGNVTNGDIDPYTPWTQPQIVRAMQIGIGITSKQSFNYSAQGVSEISTIMSYLNA